MAGLSVNIDDSADCDIVRGVSIDIHGAPVLAFLYYIQGSVQPFNRRRKKKGMACNNILLFSGILCIVNI